MNFVAGALLVIFRDVRDELEKEEKVFWTICAIVEVISVFSNVGFLSCVLLRIFFLITILRT
jgi:hypothetical protein